MWERRLVFLSVGLLAFWVLATILAVALGWPAEFDGLGDPDDVSGEWIERGTPVRSDPPTALYAVLKGVGIAGSLGLVWAGVETGVDAIRGTRPA